MSRLTSVGRVVLPLFSLFVAGALAACGDDDGSPTATPGSIQVTVNATGADLQASYQFSVDGGSAQPITTSATIDNVTAGSHTVALSGLTENCTLTTPATLDVTVTSGQTAQASFDVTCVARKIIFTSGRSGQDEVWQILSDGTGATKLTTTASGGFSATPAYSPDESKIAFARSEGSGTQIWVMNADGSSPVQLTTTGPVNAFPKWSPDGSKIAFHSTRDGNFEIYVMDASGANQTRLTNDAGTDEFPSWAPDGSKLVFASDRGGTFQLFTMNADGSEPTQLTTDANVDAAAGQWSPLGDKIVFGGSTETSAGTRTQIFVVNADGSGGTQLTQTTSNELFPSWSRDGLKIVFSSARDGGDFQLYTMNADGSNQTRLTQTSSHDLHAFWGK